LKNRRPYTDLITIDKDFGFPGMFPITEPVVGKVWRWNAGEGLYEYIIIKALTQLPQPDFNTGSKYRIELRTIFSDEDTIRITKLSGEAVLKDIEAGVLREEKDEAVLAKLALIGFLGEKDEVSTGVIQ
jgi:hypothetical protein